MYVLHDLLSLDNFPRIFYANSGLTLLSLPSASLPLRLITPCSISISRVLLSPPPPSPAAVAFSLDSCEDIQECTFQKTNDKKKLGDRIVPNFL